MWNAVEESGCSVAWQLCCRGWSGWRCAHLLCSASLWSFPVQKRVMGFAAFRDAPPSLLSWVWCQLCCSCEDGTVSWGLGRAEVWRGLLVGLASPAWPLPCLTSWKNTGEGHGCKAQVAWDNGALFPKSSFLLLWCLVWFILLNIWCFCIYGIVQWILLRLGLVLVEPTWYLSTL